MVWNQMKRFIAKEEPRTKEELMECIETFWREKMTVSQCNRYIDHMFKVAPTVVAMGGKPQVTTPKSYFLNLPKRENTKKDAAIKALEEENKQLKVEKTDHLKIIDSLRKEVKKYCVGEKVWAFYEPDNHLYPAKITDIEGSSYTVKFTEDGITATIAETELKKFTKK